MAVQRTAHQVWDRHAILAEIKRRFGSLTAFSEQVGESRSRLSAALDAPYPKVDRAIANRLGLPLGVLWPDRYLPDGTRRRSRTRRRGESSQKRGAI